MDNIVYIDGNVIAEKGIFYTRDIAAGAGEEYKKGAKVITPQDGFLKITEDYGSIFTDYYVKGEVAAGGIGDGDIYGFYHEHESTYQNYKDNILLIKCMMDEIYPSKDLENLFYQQQYVSVFGAMEYFLFDTFMGQVCNNYEIYKKVLSSHLRCLEYNSSVKDIFRGKHTLQQEKTLIEQTKHVIYHNVRQVSDLYQTAFSISVDLNILKDSIEVRNHIVHRFGYTQRGEIVDISKEKVLNLIIEVDTLVNRITREIKELA